MRKYDRKIDGAWRLWFAWHPVRAYGQHGGAWVWLELVWRKLPTSSQEWWDAEDERDEKYRMVNFKNLTGGMD